MYYISKYTCTVLQAPCSACVSVVNMLCEIAHAFPLVAAFFNRSFHNNWFQNYDLEGAIRL